MSSVDDPTLRPLFQPDANQPVRALVVAGACGNVGFGKLGQFARMLAPHGIPVVALDLSPPVHQVPAKLREAFGSRFSAAQIDTIVANVTVVQGAVADIPAELPIGFVFEAIPERLELKHAFYRQIRQRDPNAYIFSATSGFPSTMLFEGLPGADRCGVMHPFFPHLTNKLWEVPTEGATTSQETAQTVHRFLAGLGMNLIPVKDVPAFAADRIFCGMMLEAVRIHVDMGLTPAQVDDVCKQTLGTSPFLVHNRIPGANYLSAHCMKLMAAEVDSTLYAIPEAWEPYIQDPNKQWPYERGQRCPPEHRAAAGDRILGMLLALTAGMVDGRVASVDALNFLCENALAFRTGMPAMVYTLGVDRARTLVDNFCQTQAITHAQQVAPLTAFLAEAAPWHEVYVGTSVHNGIGLISLKRNAINHTLIAQLDHAYERLAGDDAVKAIVVAPDGTYCREFGHGADLGAFVPVLGKPDAARALIDRWKSTLQKFRTGKPTVAALVGRVLGGGLEFAAACQARIAGAHTRLAFPETTVGVIPGLGGCHHLHRWCEAAHWPRINELLLTGHGATVDEAADWGFVSQIVPIPQLPAASMKLAAAIADGSTPRPAFRKGPADVTVNPDVATTNEAGVSLDAELRALLISTIIEANGTDVATGDQIEAERAAQSLTMSSSAIGVKAMMRGKAPEFEHPLG